MNTSSMISRRKDTRSVVEYLLGFVVIAMSIVTIVNAAPTSDYKAIPPFVSENNAKPNVIVALDISGSMKAVAYRDTGAGNWRTGLHDDFDPTKKYFGYFDTSKLYEYDAGKGFFVETTGPKVVSDSKWDGNFLNWVAMRRIDVARKVLVGGKVRDRNGELFGSDTYYVLQGNNEPLDYSFRKSYNGSATYSPYPDSTEFTIADGQIQPTVGAGTSVTVISDKIEMGKVTMDWEYNGPWTEVPFQNTYIDPVVVVASVSFEGGDPVVTRAKDVGDATIGDNGGFRIYMQEWEYKRLKNPSKPDEAHTTEDIIYLVAEKGHHTIAMDGGKTLEFDAGTISTNQMEPSFSTTLFASSFTTTPVVFSGVGTNNESTAVTTRHRNINTASFEVAMEEQEVNAQTHISETVHFIAIAPVTGTVTSTGIPIEIANTPSAVTHQWYTINYASSFTQEPMVAFNMQTTNGGDTANVRFGNAVNSTTAIDIQVDEEKSADNEVSHAAEVVGYFATAGTGNYNIQLGVTTEPTGIIQDNQAAMRFGLAVYNYDHTKSVTSIYNGNSVHGGTLYPCYPDLNLPVSVRTNYDICKETHVKSPINNIIDVIEDYPLIWGTTPIAETLYDIYGYVAQKNFNNNGHAYWYDNGTETDTSAYPSYKISNDWDPYYYDEYGGKVACAKTFVLHLNDGAPYADWDGAGHPTVPSDGVGSTGPNEQLDDLAAWLRATDCRDDATDLVEHQEIISYYVYAALGEGEINNKSTRRMREAAANGGFVDADGDNTPDWDDGGTAKTHHPSDFIAYYKKFLDENDPNAKPCTTNEWDADGDCNPDTFYLANDGEALVAELTAAFESIARRASSGGAASVISASSNGEGAIYQAIFRTRQTGVGNFEATWTGDVHALFVDDAGRLIEDTDEDRVLDSTDKIITMCFDEAEQQTRANVTAPSGTLPTSAQIDDCSVTVFNKTLFDLKYLWNGADWLAALTNAQATAQRTYTSTTAGRYIFTGIDTNSDGLVSSTETVAFSPASFTASNAGLLQAADTTEATKIVNFIRGEDQVGYRGRILSNTVDGSDTRRLGDIIYSTPTPVSRPSEAFDLLYPVTNPGYSEYLAKYKNRRHVVYTGANDGMLHAFNGGWYDSANQKFEKGPSGKAQHDYGAELWAYVPYNLLPHLKYLTDPSYGENTSNHVYYVDLQPRIFDAQIFTPDATHPSGWGTILIGGMRYGGGEITIDADTGATVDNRTLRSSYFILDVTDPEAPPKLLLEFTHTNLGFTSSIPTPFVVNSKSSGSKWYLMLGSGPTTTKAGLEAAKSTQPGRLFLIDLENMSLETNFDGDGIFELPDANSFVSDMLAVDYNLDFDADAIYFGTVSGTTGSWGGKLYRVQIENSDGTLKAVNTWTATEVYDTGLPITAMPAVTLDKKGNRWLLVGTGRFLVKDDAQDTTTQRFFGIKEPRNSDGTFSWGSADATKMVDVSTAAVAETTAALTGVSLTGGATLPTSPTFFDLENAMLQFGSDYQAGWFRSLSPAGNRVIGEATVLGGTLTHTSYIPSAAACTVEGTAQLHAVNFSTGTAGPEAIIGIESATYLTTIDIGVAPALTPSLHTGAGYSGDNTSKAIIQTSTGKIIEIEQSNEDSVRSGEASWRELE